MSRGLPTISALDLWHAPDTPRTKSRKTLLRLSTARTVVHFPKFRLGKSRLTNLDPSFQKRPTKTPFHFRLTCLPRVTRSTSRDFPCPEPAARVLPEISSSPRGRPLRIKSLISLCRLQPIKSKFPQKVPEHVTSRSLSTAPGTRHDPSFWSSQGSSSTLVVVSHKARGLFTLETHVSSSGGG